MLNNDFIINYICKKYNINLSEFEPINENGDLTDKSFDKRFSLDRTYQYIYNNFKTRVRFVKYSENEITLFKTNIKISNIIINRLEPNQNIVYSKNYENKINIKDVEKSHKLNKINKLIKDVSNR